MIFRRGDWFVVAAGALALVSAFLPWWVVRGMVGDGKVVRERFVHGTAWRTSTRWSEAVLITVAAAAVWLLWRRFRGAVPWPVRLFLVAGVVLALYITLQQRADIGPWLRPGSYLTTTVCMGEECDRIDVGMAGRAEHWADGRMQRDDLRFMHDGSTDADVGWGLWAGIAAMLLTGIALVAAHPGDNKIPDPAS